ncbi:MAG: single-stranded DNA-binding protein [Rhodoglobus sp.]
MSDMITVTGLVATVPRHIVTSEGLAITSFRLASTQRRFDRQQNAWADGETNWYTVTSFRQLAMNVTGSVNKGDRVLVTGKLRIRDWTSGEKAGTTIDVEAEAIGHDLLWGNSVFSRTIANASRADEAAEQFPAEATVDADSDDAESGEDAHDLVEAGQLPVPF